MAEMRPFSKYDWHGWSGAESPPNNVPHIGYASADPRDWPLESDHTWYLDGMGLTIIVDANGLAIVALDGWFQADISFERALKLASEIPDLVSRKWCVDHGLQEFNFQPQGDAREPEAD